jgi:hypothetical protein
MYISIKKIKMVNQAGWFIHQSMSKPAPINVQGESNMAEKIMD